MENQISFSKNSLELKIKLNHFWDKIKPHLIETPEKPNEQININKSIKLDNKRLGKLI